MMKKFLKSKIWSWNQSNIHKKIDLILVNSKKEGLDCGGICLF